MKPIKSAEEFKRILDRAAEEHEKRDLTHVDLGILEEAAEYPCGDRAYCSEEDPSGEKCKSYEECLPEEITEGHGKTDVSCMHGSRWIWWYPEPDKGEWQNVVHCSVCDCGDPPAPFKKETTP